MGLFDNQKISEKRVLERLNDLESAVQQLSNPTGIGSYGALQVGTETIITPEETIVAGVDMNELDDSIDDDGAWINELINASLDTSSKSILGAYDFGATDYAGGVKAGDITWNATTGAITGGSGVVLNRAGILGAAAGVATFTLNAATGAATFAGTLSAPSGTLGTITAGTITGATIRTSAPGAGTGEGVLIEGGDSKYIKLYYNTNLVGWIKGYTTEGAETTYINIEAASGRKIKFKNSYIECSGDFHPNGDEEYSMGTASDKWDHITANTFYQSTNTNGSRQVYDAAYIEMNLVPKKLIKQLTKKSKGVECLNGYIEGLKLPFKKGTVLMWTGKKLEESKNETDFAIAVADKDGLPIVLGAEPVRVIGSVKVGDILVPSNKKGCAMKSKDNININAIGRCLKNKRTKKEGLVNVMIKF